MATKGLGRIKLKASELTDTGAINQRTLANILDRLKIQAVSLWEWEGLPDSLNDRYMENALYERGRVGIVETSKGLLSLNIAPAGDLNVYGEPIVWRAWGLGFEERVPAERVAVIKNNAIEMPTVDTALLYAQRLYEVERSADTNVKLQKYPFIVKVDEQDLLTMKNLIAQYEGNVPFIYASKSLNMDSLDVFGTEVPYVADRLLEYKRNVFNDFLSFLGVNNNPSADKKERLVVSEEASNLEAIALSRWSFKKYRELGANDANEKFGLDIRVEVAQDIPDYIKDLNDLDNELDFDLDSEAECRGEESWQSTP